MNQRPVRVSSLVRASAAIIALILPLARADVIKRSNPPTPDPGGTNYLGWIERSQHGGALTQLVSSAWVSADDTAVNRIRWWGGYEGWTGATPPPGAPTTFVFRIWSHNPNSDFLPFRQPQTVLWTATVSGVSATFEKGITDPRTETNTTNSVFRYQVDIPSGAAFVPDPAPNTYYWLTIGASDTGAPPAHPWGWLLRQHPMQQSGPGSGVLITDPVAPGLGDQFASGSVAAGGQPWDSAFVLSMVGAATEDFGDAPDSYGTTLAADGARHTVGSPLFLGGAPDAESDGFPTAAANGDDTNGSDDENGVTLGGAFIPGTTHSVTVTASVAGGTLNAWVDFDRNGNWSAPEEHVASSVALAAGPNVISFAVPVSAVGGVSFARFRLTTQVLSSPVGAASDGEVEDYAVAIGGKDFGDAPAGYPVTLSSDGARHVTPSALWMGGAADAEPDGQPSASADGDDLAGTDDEDGVVFDDSLSPGGSASFSVDASAPGLVNAWVDFDGNLSWDSAAEWVVTNASVAAGTSIIPFIVPANAMTGTVFARVRIATAPLAGPTGEAADGEVEDYPVAIANLDFGDAPASFSTLRAVNGARHVTPSALWLGTTAPDAEPDGQPSAEADGDDLAGTDDEDGVTFSGPLAPGQTQSLSVVASAEGLVSVWIDFNGSGAWNNTTERIATNVAVSAGANTLYFVTPTGAVSAAAMARVRIATAPIAGPVGLAQDGEVEDLLTPGLKDFGDAPDSNNAQGQQMTAYPGVPGNFPTTESTPSTPGPRHRFPTAVAWLGAAVTAEEHAEYGVDPDVTNNIVPASDLSNKDGADDGLVFPLNLPSCEATSLLYVVSAATTPTGALYLNVWADWNRDGDWGDSMSCGAGSVEEWPIRNEVVNIPGPGIFTNATPLFVAWHPQSGASTPFWLRISLAEQPLNASGLERPGHGPEAGYQFGETEDYFISNYGNTAYDYGDAPTSFPVSIAQQGARHLIDPAIRLGVSIDDETNGQASADCAGDDLAGVDDEDGLVFPVSITAGETVTAQVSASVSGFLGGWLDSNGDGDWDDEGEHVWQALPVVSGVNLITLQVPGAMAGNHAFRARFATHTGDVALVTGTAADGEVEDYVIAIGTGGGPRDWGDAPAPFPVLSGDNGANHAAGSSLRLGQEWDAESQGQPSAGADADDLGGAPDDEDGVSLPDGLTVGRTNTIRVVASQPGILQAWMDLNQDGSWSGAGEQVFGNVNVAAGANDLSALIPSSVTGDTIVARFRLSSNIGLAETGPAADGEVEDYVFNLTKLDFGDAPATYPVRIDQDGARHAGPSPIFLGSAWDAELTGQASSGADADDLDGATDDEDGITAPLGLFGGATNVIRVIASTSGVLNAWMDLDGNGDWSGADEHVFSNVMVSAGSQDLLVHLPVSVAQGPMMSRFRISSVSNLTVFGLAPDGEVEDHALYIGGMDYGDAPNSYPVTLAQNGARHAGPPSLCFGAEWDAEADGQPSPLADGDDSAEIPDDEDGITLPSGLSAGVTGIVRVVVTGPGILNAWMDFDQNGAWAGTGECIFSNVSVHAGTNDLNVFIPGSVTGNLLVARFRVSSVANLGVTGPAPDGEVEDYVFALRSFDFGDAPDSYPVRLGQDGARHLGPTAPFLGAAWDAEVNGQSSLQADGDDTNGVPDDEDGITLPSDVYSGITNVFRVSASAPGVLNAWFDLDANGDWSGADEHVLSNVIVEAGSHDFSIFLPSTVPGGLMMTRFRISSMSNLTFTGEAPDGEVEDHAIPVIGMDYGDAPAAYPVTLAQNGARHAGPPTIRFGAAWDGEADGQPSPAALGDDEAGFPDDEDGVTVPSGLVAGTTSTVRIVTSAAGILNAWIDLNRNGSWSESGEQVFSNRAVGAGITNLTLVIPSSVTSGALVARFRISSAQDLAPTGMAPDGEVEDHVLALQEFDLGDAPSTFPVTLAKDGARHLGPSTYYLGSAWDGETDGHPGAACTGDDMDGAVDDEDGVSLPFTFMPGATNVVRVLASRAGVLNAWMDFDGSGTWTGAAEHVLNNVSLSAGTNDLLVPVPPTVLPGSIASRFRFSSAAGLDVTGAAPDGEVEDHALLVQGLDFGDAPDSYPVTRAQDGARHTVVNGVRLGAAIDQESDGQSTWLANGDDLAGTNDEDGVQLVSPLQAGQTVTVQVTCSTSGFISAWMDWNADGDWNDAGEQPLSAVAVEAGPTNFTFTAAPSLPGLRVVGRFRFSTQAGQIAAPTGAASDGEVEDYAFPIAGRDFGDAPTNYPTRLAQNGAAHIVVAGVHMGSLADTEGDGQPSAGATGDDAAGSDDEDGVVLLSSLISGQVVTARVAVSANGYVGAWMDWNGDGDWDDAQEHVAESVATHGAPSIDIAMTVPANLPSQGVVARFRYATLTNEVATPTGLASDGEVEDYLFTLVDTDFGDAPANYPTRLSQDGARHTITPGVVLGALIDADADGQPTAQADGDDLNASDDEDGVTLPAVVLPGQAYTASVSASVSGFIGAWMDWNGDGDWADAQEQVFAASPVHAGANALPFAVPADAVASPLIIRFRFSTQAGQIAQPTGPTSDGEVEDYAIMLSGLDFGDAPTNFPTRLAQDGARHRVVAGVHLGALIDQEADGQASATADGDDLGGAADEDGVVLVSPLLEGRAVTVRVTSAVSGVLGAWFDWNGDGDWNDPQEQVIPSAPLSPGGFDFSIVAPASIPVSRVVARFRFATQLGDVASPTGLASDGEVEDYAFPVAQMDLGDAPAPYPVLVAENGARHLIKPGLKLGAVVDAELEGQPSAGADGDDLNGGPNDEDGVAMSGSWLRGSTQTVSVVASTNGLLNVWIDFDRDGSWSGALEQVETDLPVVAGTNTLSIAIPLDALVGPSCARFRLSTAAGLSFTGPAPDGEVEDHAFVFSQVASLDPLTITNVERAAEALRVGVAATQDVYLVLQGTTNLSSADANWSPVGSMVRGPTSVLTDGNAAQTQKAYRVVVPYVQ